MKKKSNIVESRVARLAYNTNGWIMPSGPFGKSPHRDSHEARYGYGHEEWLLDTGKLIDGYHYGFLEPIRKQQEAYMDNIYNVWLYTIDGVSKKRYWIGEINELEALNPKEASLIKETYFNKGWLKEMEQQIVASGANSKGFSEWEGVDLFNVKFRPENLNINEDYIELPPEHPLISQSRYTFAHYKEEFTIGTEVASNGDFTFQKDEDEIDNSASDFTSKHYLREPRQIEITYLHNEISAKLTKRLKGQYGSINVKAEHRTGVGSSRIDIVVNSKQDGLIFYEIKTYNSVKLSIRMAVGQLLEYAMWPNSTRAKKLVIVTQKQEDLAEVKTYFKHLRSELRLPIYYQWFDVNKAELSELY